jgi:hypothetical protein
MTVLDLVKEFCGKKTLPVPATLVSNTDVGVLQIFYLLQETVRELSKYTWNEQKIADTFTTVAAQDQGALTSILGADFNSLVFATMQNTTTGIPVFGPVSDALWASLQTFPSSGPDYQFKVFGKNLHIYPAPPAGETVYLIYQSKYGVAAAAGTPKEFITVDTDVFLIPEEVVSRGLDWRWKQAQGEDWATDYQIYGDLLQKALQKTGLPTFHLDSPEMNMTPGIFVPAGNW